MAKPWKLETFEPHHARLLALTGPAALALRGALAPGTAGEGAGESAGEGAAFGEALERQARRMAGAGPAWSLVEGGDGGGRVLACGGAVRFWPGVGELWLWLGEGAGENPVALARRARLALGLLRQREGFVRLQAHVRQDNQAAIRFVEFLGLRPEGVCPGYGPDHATHHLYGRFWQWKV